MEYTEDSTVAQASIRAQPCSTRPTSTATSSIAGTDGNHTRETYRTETSRSVSRGNIEHDLLGIDGSRSFQTGYSAATGTNGTVKKSSVENELANMTTMKQTRKVSREVHRKQREIEHHYKTATGSS